MSAKPKRPKQKKAAANRSGRPSRGFEPSSCTDEEILACYKECGSKNETVRRMKIGDKRLSRILRDAGVATAKATKKSPAGVVDVDSFISNHKLDYAQTLRDACKELLVGNATLEPDKLRRYVSIPQDSWKELINTEEFMAFQVMQRNNRRRIWCSASAREKLLQLDAIEEVR